MKLCLGLILLSILVSNCQSSDYEKKHIFYLHGRIVEVQGINAFSEQFGRYEYNAIKDTLANTKAMIHAEIRNENIDFHFFCKYISEEINSLIKKGVLAENITVIGASKGGVMAMNISNMNTNPINYVLLASNTKEIEQENHWNLHGRILGIYEKSDSLAGNNYDHWIKQSTNAIEFKQIRINTGLGHGFLFRPLNEWMIPTKEWIKN